MFGADKGKADKLDGKGLCIGIVQTTSRPKRSISWPVSAAA